MTLQLLGQPAGDPWRGGCTEIMWTVTTVQDTLSSFTVSVPKTCVLGIVGGDEGVGGGSELMI